jgi:hypothetical protein
VLFPTELDMANEYESSFRGMTTEPIELTELLAARERLLDELPRSLTADERAFLISLAHAEPKWNLLDVGHARELPAIKWKLQNLRRLAAENEAKLHAQADELVRRFQRL